MASAYLAQFLAGKPSFGEEFIGDIEARDKVRREQELQAAAAETRRMIALGANKAQEDARVNSVLRQAPGADEAAIRANRDAYAANGRVFGSYDEYKIDHEGAAKKKVEADALAMRQTELDAIDKTKSASVKKFTDLKAGAMDALLASGLKKEEITPEMLAAGNATLDGKIKELEAEAEIAKAEATNPRNKANSLSFVKKHNSIIKTLQNLDALKKSASGVVSAGTAEKTFRQSVGADAAALLEAELVTNRAQAEPDPRAYDRAREQYLESATPDILELASVDPAGAKMLLDQIKSNSAQGDKGIEREAKDARSREASQTKLLASYKTLRSNQERALMDAEKAQREYELKLAEHKRRKDKDASWREVQDAFNATKRQLGVLQYTTSAANTLKRAMASLGSSALSSGVPFTEQTRSMYGTLTKSIEDVALDDRTQSALSAFPDALPGGLAANTRGQITAGKTPGGTFKKPETKLEAGQAETPKYVEMPESGSGKLVDTVVRKQTKKAGRGRSPMMKSARLADDPDL